MAVPGDDLKKEILDPDAAAIYKNLFEQVPVGILEEDYSYLKRLVDAHRFSNSMELRDYFSRNPESLLDAILNCTVLNINPAGLRAYGAATIEEFMIDHKDYDSWMSFDWVDFYLDEVEALFNNDLPFQREFADTSVSGKPIFIRNVTNIVDGHSGDWARMISIVEDITDKKKMETQLHQAQKMEAIGQLTGGLAHDVNNILAIISGNMEILKEDFPEGHTTISETLKAIKTGAGLVKQLLSFSESQPIEPQVVNINDLALDLVALLKRTLGEAISVELHTGLDTWLVETDPIRLENAILNLVLNARDAMPDGGKLVIETLNETVEHEYLNNQQIIGTGQFAVISVTDDGRGMSDEQVRNAFNPYYTTKQSGSTSGLGLSSVYGFANQTRGHVTIFSSKGVGTEVRIFIPKTDKSASLIYGHSLDSAPKGRGQDILLLEDEKALSTLVTGMLEELGYAVTVAESGEAALDLLVVPNLIDLLLTDVGLPGKLTGLDVVRRARKIKPDIKVQLMSSYIAQGEISANELEQYGGILDKPFRKSELAQRLNLVFHPDQE